MPLSIESNGSAKTKPREGVKAKVSGLPTLATATASTQIQIQIQMRMRPGAMRGEDVAQFSLSTLLLAIVSLFVSTFAESSGSVRFGFDCDLLRVSGFVVYSGGVGGGNFTLPWQSFVYGDSIKNLLWTNFSIFQILFSLLSPLCPSLSLSLCLSVCVYSSFWLASKEMLDF